MIIRLDSAIAAVFAVLFLAGAETIHAEDIAVKVETAETVRIQVDTKTPGMRISPDFIGLGYESSAVAQADFFNPKNVRMVRLYRSLSPHGLIRIGGNVSDHTRYVPDGTAAAHTERETTVLNQKSLAGLGGFARATGWKVMWGLNLGTGSQEEAVAEAKDVSAALGDRLHSFEIGNEVEALPRFKRSYEAYHAAYLDYKAAIRAALPNAPFSGPDSIGNLDWIVNFAMTEAGDMKLLTQHYYRGGARDPASTLEKLLQRDEAWEERLKTLRQLSRDHRVAFRINEVNSFYGGGKPGVSDTFGSALWCLDYLFLLASYGCDGVNMETDVNQLGFISHYSPIVHDAQGLCSARPEYYGMLAFAMAGKGDLLRPAVNKGKINLSCYAAKTKREVWVTVINKDLQRDANVEIALPEGYASAEAFRLRAPSPESTEQVTLAGTAVSEDSKWSAGPPEKVMVKERSARLSVPHASATLIRLR